MNEVAISHNFINIDTNYYFIILLVQIINEYR